MNNKQLKIKSYFALSILILIMIGLVGCGTLEVGAVSEDSQGIDAGLAEESSVTGIEFGIEPTPMPETFTYANDFYGFKFDYPETWTLKEEDHGVLLEKGSNNLRINFRWINENYNFGRTGMAAGTPIYSDKIIFMGQVIPQFTVELDHLAKYVIYSETVLFEFEDLVFGIVLEDTLTDYMELDLPDEIIAEAKNILESFERIEATGTPGESSPTPEADVSPPPGIPVVAWLGHIASLPEGSRYDDMVVLSPEGTGVFGVMGNTPAIEDEIISLRDTEGPHEYAHLWGTLSCGVDDFNNCRLLVERLQYGANYSEQEISDWFGTIKKTTFNGGDSFVFELLGEYPVWYSIHASQDASLQAQIAHFFETGEVVEVSGLLMVGVPDVNGTRIEIRSIEARSITGSPRKDIVDGVVYENQEYGFSFLYPSHMSVVEEPNRVLVNNGSLQLAIAHRRANENVQISDIGDFTGKYQVINDLYFLGSFVPVVLNIQDGYITAASLGDPGIELGEGTPIRFVVSLVNTDGGRISNAQVDEMLQIFQKFALTSD